MYLPKKLNRKDTLRIRKEPLSKTLRKPCDLCGKKIYKWKTKH